MAPVLLTSGVAAPSSPINPFTPAAPPQTPAPSSGGSNTGLPQSTLNVRATSLYYPTEWFPSQEIAMLICFLPEMPRANSAFPCSASSQCNHCSGWPPVLLLPCCFLVERAPRLCALALDCLLNSVASSDIHWVRPERASLRRENGGGMDSTLKLLRRICVRSLELLRCAVCRTWWCTAMLLRRSCLATPQCSMQCKSLARRTPRTAS